MLKKFQFQFNIEVYFAFKFNRRYYSLPFNWIKLNFIHCLFWVCISFSIYNLEFYFSFQTQIKIRFKFKRKKNMNFTIEFVRFLMRNFYNSSDKMHKHYIRFPIIEISKSHKPILCVSQFDKQAVSKAKNTKQKYKDIKYKVKKRIFQY